MTQELAVPEPTPFGYFVGQRIGSLVLVKVKEGEGAYRYFWVKIPEDVNDND